MAKVEEWKKRRDEIEEELNRVWVQGDEGEQELAPPPYLEKENGGDREMEQAVESGSEKSPASEE